jgi:hypothetical protein
MTSRTYRDFTADCEANAAGIAEPTRAAFTKEFSSGDGEVALIAALRADSDVAVELHSDSLRSGRWKLQYPLAFESV